MLRVGASIAAKDGNKSPFSVASAAVGGGCVGGHIGREVTITCTRYSVAESLAHVLHNFKVPTELRIVVVPKEQRGYTP